MKYRVDITERYNLGNYEFTEVSGSVEFSDDEAGGDPADFAMQALDDLLRSHRMRAERLVPEGASSYILDHPALED